MSEIVLEPYLYFTGNCREAMAFYHGVFGGDLSVMDMPDNPAKVMHSRLSGGMVTLLASDGQRTEPYGTSAISLNLTGDDEEKLRKAFAALSEGGKVTSELKKEFWGDTFGSLTDKYGIDWQVNITQPKPAAA